MTRQERLQIDVVAGFLKKEGVDYSINKKGKHAALVAAGRRFTLMGSPSMDDKQVSRTCQRRAKRFVEAIRGDSLARGSAAR